MRSKYDIILFDLDGTLSQSADGIRQTIEYTLKKMNKPVPDLSQYSLYIGPPLRHTFLNLCSLNEDESDIAVEIYRKRYSEVGKNLNRLFDGTDSVLAALKESGAKLAVTSSKYEPFVREIVSALNIEKYFDAVCGSNLDETRKEKEDLIPYSVSCLNGSMTDRIAMVVDTTYDVIGAKLTNTDFIGVSYGYGNIYDMKKLGADKFADSPAQLLNFLMTDD